MVKMKAPLAMVATALSGTVPPPDADEDVRACQRLVQSAGEAGSVGAKGYVVFDGGEVVAVSVHDAAAVGHRDVPNACLHEDFGDRDAGRACTGDDRAQIGEIAAGEPGGVAQCCKGDNGCAVLVVVKGRDVEAVVEFAFDLEAAGCGYVLEVDTAEGRSEPGDGLHDLVDVRGGQHDGHSVHCAQLLEQNRFALLRLHRPHERRGMRSSDQPAARR